MKIKIDTKEFTTYGELLVAYLKALESCIITKKGQRKALCMNVIVDLELTHKKYHELQKSLFPNEVGIEFIHLYVNGVDILNSKLGN